MKPWRWPFEAIGWTMLAAAVVMYAPLIAFAAASSWVDGSGKRP